MENIALAFSGGGFRAAAFSLGSLDYLNQARYNNKPLLQNVDFISSTSGGSITNLLYSAYIYEGKSFDEVYKKLLELFEADKLLSEALHNLNHAQPWKERPFKTRNLINAFSLVYDKYFEGREWGMFSNRNNNPHLEEICVNSTEFTNGYAFRFQSHNDAIPDHNGWIGNNYIHFTDDGGRNGIDAAKKLKLADVLASSSCFPSGFEPLIFPDDYATTAISKESLFKGLQFDTNNFSLDTENYNNTDFLKDKKFKPGTQFGIMDGGVADNQAIDAFMLADKRREKYKVIPFSLFMSCDVTSYFMDGYTLPVTKNKWYSFISFNAAKWVLITILLLTAAWLPFSLWYFWDNWKWWNTISSIVSGFFFLPIAAWLLSMLFKKKSSEPESTWGIIFKKYSHVFTGMSLSRLKTMLLTRGKSVFILANDIYLKQIRRLYYDRLYSDPKYKDRIIQNAIYDLSQAKFNPAKPPKAEPTDPPPPSDKIKEVAEKARTMGTTLWFDENHQKNNLLNCILATGRFTTCYSLLKFIRKMSVKSPAIIELENQLMADYNQFQNDPMWGMRK
jgi:hypothetical protein